MKNRQILNWESHLVQRAACGESAAFELLIDDYRPMLQNLAMRMLRNADDAHDAVQETFVKAYKAIRGFDPFRPLQPWLCRICGNCCIDIARNRRRTGESLDDHEYMLMDVADPADACAARNMEQDHVLEAVGRLPENYRRIVLMRHFQHKDVNEIAAELQTPEGTVKSWLFRARALLKKDLRVALG